MNTMSLDDGNNSSVVILPDKAIKRLIFCVQDTFVCVILLLFMR